MKLNWEYYSDRAEAKYNGITWVVYELDDNSGYAINVTDGGTTRFPLLSDADYGRTFDDDKEAEKYLEKLAEFYQKIEEAKAQWKNFKFFKCIV